MQIISPSIQTSADSLSQAMSQVSLRDMEITGLNNQNKILEDIVVKREQERKKSENKCKELIDENNKLTKQVIGQSALQWAKHIIWDVLITEATKIRPYLDYILDQEIVMRASRQSVTVVRQVLNKKPIDTAQNAIYFLNSLTKEEIRKEHIKYSVGIGVCT